MASKNKGSLEPGSELFDYHVLEFIGEGSGAYVYKAQHLKLRRLAAIKQLKPDLVENEDALQRFLREAHIVARLNHPNVVTIYDLEHDEETGSYYIITEFTEEGSLADRLQESPEGLPIDQVRYIAMQICSGLEAAHRAGIVHRDVKPDNILLFDVGEGQYVPKLCDFGIARAPTLTGVIVPPTTSGVVGTFYYMSPEQLDEDIKVDHRSDLYSLGILLYELLTGQVPFTGDIPAVFWSHMYVSPTPPSELRPDIPEALEQVVLRALRKDSDDRYQSAAEMYEAIKALHDASTRRESRHKFKALLAQGQAHIEREEWKEAIEVLGQADVLEPGDERVQASLQKAREQWTLQEMYELGVQSLEAKDWEKAREHLADVMCLDPDYAGGRAKEHLELAVQELGRERSRRDLMVQYRIGMGYFHKRQWVPAIRELKQVIAQDPEYEDAADRLAEAQREIKGTVRGWWHDRGRRTKAALVGGPLGLIALAVCIAVIAPQWSGASPFITPMPTPTSSATSVPAYVSTDSATPTPPLTPTDTSSPTPTHTPSPTPTNTPSPAPTHTPSRTPTNTPSRTPTNTSSPTPTNTSSPAPTHTPTRRPTTPPVVLIGPADESEFPGGGRILFHWTGPEPEAGGYYEVRVNGGSIGAAWFNSGLQQWEALWEPAQVGAHTWQVFLMAADQQTVRWSGPVRILNIRKDDGNGNGPPPPPPPPTPPADSIAMITARMQKA